MSATPGRNAAGATMRALPLSVVALVVGALSAATAAAAADDTVYRCADGHSYSQQPCAAGQPVPVDDARTPAQRRDGERAAQREAALAAQLQREREAREAAPANRAIGIGPAARPAAAASAPHHHKKTDKTSARRRKHKPTSAAADDPTLSPPVRVPKAATR